LAGAAESVVDQPFKLVSTAGSGIPAISSLEGRYLQQPSQLDEVNKET